MEEKRLMARRRKPYKTLVIPEGSLDPDVTNVIIVPKELQNCPRVYTQPNINEVATTFELPTLPIISPVSVKEPKYYPEPPPCQQKPAVPCQTVGTASCGTNQANTECKRHVKKSCNSTQIEECCEISSEDEFDNREKDLQRKRKLIQKKIEEIEEQEEKIGSQHLDNKKAKNKAFSAITYPMPSSRRFEDDESDSSSSSDRSTDSRKKRARERATRRRRKKRSKVRQEPEYDEEQPQIQSGKYNPAQPSVGCSSSCNYGPSPSAYTSPPDQSPVNVIPQPYVAPPYRPYGLNMDLKNNWPASYQYSSPLNAAPVEIPNTLPQQVVPQVMPQPVYAQQIVPQPGPQQQIYMQPAYPQMMVQPQVVEVPRPPLSYSEFAGAASYADSITQFIPSNLGSTVLPVGPDTYILSRPLPDGSILYQGVFKVKKQKRK